MKDTLTEPLLKYTTNNLAENKESVALGQSVIAREIEGLRALESSIGSEFARAVNMIRSANGRTIVTGMGKSGHIARKIAATMASTGTPAQFVHPAEASHGDLGMITDQDICLVISNSGESRELADIIAHTKRFGIELIAITQKPDSTLGKQAGVTLTIPSIAEACGMDVVPTTSTTNTLALGDALAIAVMRLRGFEREHFRAFHPGGKLGSQLLSVKDLMRTGPDLPTVEPELGMDQALLVMTSKGLGTAVVVEGYELVGVITDGDLRRNLPDLLSKTADEVCTRAPKSIKECQLATEAVRMMNENKVMILCVVDEKGHFHGLIHVHDCLKAGVE